MIISKKGGCAAGVLVFGCAAAAGLFALTTGTFGAALAWVLLFETFLVHERGAGVLVVAVGAAEEFWTGDVSIEVSADVAWSSGVDVKTGAGCSFVDDSSLTSIIIELIS